MAYIGNSPANVGNYQVVDDISSTFNGTLTSFALTALTLPINPAKSGQLLVSINGVLQEPDDTGAEGFKVSGSNIVFSSAPATGSTFWAVWQGQAVDIGTPSDGVVGTAQMSSAELELTGGLSLGDNVKAKFGASDDLQIYHDGSNSYIKDTGDGELKIETNGSTIRLITAEGDTLASFVRDGASNLRYDGSNKLATTSTGVDVTGSVTCDGFTSTGIDDNATSTAITIDSSENVGISATPEAWANGWRMLDMGLGGAFGSNASTNARMLANGYYSATGWKYKSTDKAAMNSQTAGTHVFYVAPSGTADTAITWETKASIDTDGLKFNGDTAAANALDDYEEGTWTPTILGGTLTISSITKATYTKIGNVVTIQGYVNLNNDGNNTHCVISGLPFTSSNSELMLGGVTHDGGVLTDQKYLRVAHTATYFHIYKNGSSPAPQSDVDGSWFIFSVTYKT